MRLIPSSVIAKGKEVITASGAPHQEKELIRLICERKEELLVTRSLLIQSSAYFAAILSEESVWEESSEKTIELDAWPRNDLAAILRSLETKNIGPIFKHVNHYFPAINYFLITPLLEPCIEFLLGNISDDSVIDSLQLAERFSVVELRDECMKYLEKYLRILPEVLRNSQGLRQKMTAEILRKLLRHEKLVVQNEDEVLSMIDIWCSLGLRKLQRVKLLHEVRFAHLTESAFEMCRQDAQCLEVPQFRRLLETPRWSDLNDDDLSGRNLNRVHYHIVGLSSTIYFYEGRNLRKYSTGVFVHCSESGTLIPARNAISAVYAQSMIDHNSSVMYGKGLFVLQRHEDTLRRNGRVQCFTGFQYFSDFRDSEPTSTIRFPKSLYVVAPPVAFENDLFIVHMPFKKHPTLSLGFDNTKKYENFTGMEILRFRDGKSTSRKLQVPVEYDPQPHTRGYDEPDPNKLFVSNKWTILLLASQGVLVVIDSPHPVGPIIEIPEKCWKMEQPNLIKIRTFSDLVIVGNVAYVLMRFNKLHERWHPGDRDSLLHEAGPAGSLTAYDLTEGKWLPDHFVDLETIYSERRGSRAHDDKVLQNFLKVVQNEVFLIVITLRIGLRKSGSPLAAESYVYRLEHSADGLCLIPDSDGQFKPLEYSGFSWKGYPMNVDAHLCEYATALQCKASREEDPIEREKLRRFIW